MTGSHRARSNGLLLLLCAAGAPLFAASSIRQDGSPSAVHRERVDRANEAIKAGDLASARAIAAEAVAALLSHSETEQDASWLALLDDAGSAAWDANDVRTAHSAWQRVFDVRSRTLSDDDPKLQSSRVGLALALRGVDDFEAARPLLEKVIEVYSKTVSTDDPRLVQARQHLGATLYGLRDFSAACVLQEQILEQATRTLGADDTNLQRARVNLATTLQALGEVHRARELLEKAFEVYSRTLPADHPSLQTAQWNLALTLFSLGDVRAARVLQEGVLEQLTKTLPADHPDLQRARSNLAGTLYALGDVQGARVMQEQVLEVWSRTLPDDHPDLQGVRQNLALSIEELGDARGARALKEKVLEVCASTLPADHPDVLAARSNLGMTILELGDASRAREMFEKVLEVQSRTLSDEHPDLQATRRNLARALFVLGDLPGSRALREKVLEVQAKTLPDEHQELQRARMYLAVTIATQSTSASNGNEAERERCVELIAELCRAQVRAARRLILESTSREAEERCADLDWSIDAALSFAQGYGAFEPPRMLEREAFVLSEATRGAAIATAVLTQAARGSPRYAALRRDLRAATEELAALSQNGSTREEFERARTHRESAERQLVDLARELSGRTAAEIDVESVATSLGERGAAVAFRRFVCSRVKERTSEKLVAFVVRSGALTLVDLGLIEPIEGAVRAWREGLISANDSRGAAATVHPAAPVDQRARGVALRERIVDPLLPALAGAERWVVVLDDVLHVIPLDALPVGDRECVGDRWKIELHTTLGDLVQKREPIRDSGSLVALGDVAYGGPESATESASEMKPRSDERAGILRDTAWSAGFTQLPGTRLEVRGIAGSFVDRFGVSEDRATLLGGHEASREALEQIAPRARYLHVATHGWFAPESIRSWSDPEPLDKHTGLGSRSSSEDQVKGLSPMLLCGLALAGANLPADGLGRVRGLMTAEELSTLELPQCELAVLSACDTNVGVRRAGQGVASLQRALHMAGARSVITSLWKVPDEATKELMLDFYRRMWVEKKPKHQALWEAKTKLREARDERGAPKYTTRDWAAWVLTGNPE